MAGLRERKKEQTRRQIADAAKRLFTEHGFERVTVARIAAVAQVSEATVFNHFPTKEDLLYLQLEEFGGTLIEAVRTRPAGESAITAFRRALLGSGRALVAIEAGDATALERLRSLSRVIADSPTLQARERLAIARNTAALTDVLAAEQLAGPTRGLPAEVRVAAAVTAHALMGVHSVLIAHVRERILADDDPTGLAAEVTTLAEHAFALLEQGIAHRP